MENIAKAIQEVMKEINWVAKNLNVWTWKSSYKWVADKDVKQTIRESMIKNWLSILPIWWKSNIKVDRWEEDTNYWLKQKQSVFTDIETKYLLLHTSWESIELYWYWQWVDTQDKWAGKATTYALKNTLLNMFLTPTWVDTDNTHSDEIPVANSKKVKYFKYKDLVEIVESWNTTAERIAKIIKEDWYTLSKYAKVAIRHYVDTGEIEKDLFFPPKK